jgi:type III secretion protein T
MNPASLDDLPVLLAWLALCSMRVGVAVALVPMLSRKMLPVLIRGALIMAVALPVALQAVSQPFPQTLAAWPLLVLFVREAAIGAVIGLAFGALCAALQVAGEIIDHQTGQTFTQNIDPTHGNSVGTTALLLEKVLFGVLMSAGFLVVMADTLYLSFELWPIGNPLPDITHLAPLKLAVETGRLFALALLLAGPVLMVLFVLDVGLGLLNRAAPQFHIFEITLTMKSMVGLAVLAVAFPSIMERVVRAMGELAERLAQLARGG